MRSGLCDTRQMRSSVAFTAQVLVRPVCACGPGARCNAGARRVHASVRDSAHAALPTRGGRAPRVHHAAPAACAATAPTADCRDDPKLPTKRSVGSGCSRVRRVHFGRAVYTLDCFLLTPYKIQRGVPPPCALFSRVAARASKASTRHASVRPSPLSASRPHHGAASKHKHATGASVHHAVG